MVRTASRRAQFTIGFGSGMTLVSLVHFLVMVG